MFNVAVRFSLHEKMIQIKFSQGQQPTKTISGNFSCAKFPLDSFCRDILSSSKSSKSVIGARFHSCPRRRSLRELHRDRADLLGTPRLPRGRRCCHSPCNKTPAVYVTPKPQGPMAGPSMGTSGRYIYRSNEIPIKKQPPFMNSCRYKYEYQSHGMDMGKANIAFRTGITMNEAPHICPQVFLLKVAFIQAMATFFLRCSGKSRKC